MEFKNGPSGDFFVIRPILGDDELLNGELLKSEAISVFEMGQKNILLDFTNIGYISSRLIGLLISLHKTIVNNAGKLTLLIPNANLVDILDRTGAKNVLTVVQDFSEIFPGAEKDKKIKSSPKISEDDKVPPPEPETKSATKSEFDVLREELAGKAAAAKAAQEKNSSVPVSTTISKPAVSVTVSKPEPVTPPPPPVETITKPAPVVASVSPTAAKPAPVAPVSATVSKPGSAVPLSAGIAKPESKVKPLGLRVPGSVSTGMSMQAKAFSAKTETHKNTKPESTKIQIEKQKKKSSRYGVIILVLFCVAVGIVGGIVLFRLIKSASGIKVLNSINTLSPGKTELERQKDSLIAKENSDKKAAASLAAEGKREEMEKEIIRKKANTERAERRKETTEYKEKVKKPARREAPEQPAVSRPAVPVPEQVQQTPTAPPASAPSESPASSTGNKVGSLFVASSPALADIYFNGQKIGTTNVTNLELPVGTVTLIFKKGNLSTTKTFEISEGKNKSEYVYITSSGAPAAGQ
jgi:anti-anti-sigma factor